MSNVKRIRNIGAMVAVMLTVLCVAWSADAHRTVSHTDCTMKTSTGGVYHTQVCEKKIKGNVVTIPPHSHELRDNGTIKTKAGSLGTVLDVTFGNTRCTARNFAIMSTIAQCFRDIFQDVGQTAIENTVNTFGYLVTLVAGLVIMFFGIKVVFGGMPIKPELFTLILKLAIVMVFASSSAVVVKWWGWAVQAPVEMGSLITDNLFDPTIGVFTSTGHLEQDLANLDMLMEQAKGDENKLKDLTTKKERVQKKINALENQNSIALSCPYVDVSMTNPLSIFARFDCIINHSLGIYGGIKGFIGAGTVLAGTLFVGGLGAVLFFVAFAAFFLMFASFFQATIIYLTSIIALTVMATLLPIVLPMWLFGNRQLQSMAGQYVSYILAYIVQPFIMFVFIAIMLIAISFVTVELEGMYKDAYKTANNSRGNTSMTLFSTPKTEVGPEQVPTFMESLIAQNAAGKDKQVIGSSGYYEYRVVDGGSGVRAVYVESKGNDTSLEMSLSVPILDWSKEKRRRFLTITLAYLIFMWVMFSFLRRIPHLSGQLVGRIHPPSITSALSSLPDKAYEAVRSRTGKTEEPTKRR